MAHKISFKGLIAASCLSLSLFGCASQPSFNSEQTLGQAYCCYDLESLPFKQLPLNKKVKLQIGDGDSVYQFDTGRSYLEALVLPSVAKPYLLEIESIATTADNARSSTLFFPIISFLDENKKLIKTVKDLPFNYASKLVGRGRMSMRYPIDKRMADAKYLLIYTSDEMLDRAISTTHEGEILRVSGFNSIIYTPLSESRYRLNFAPEGWLNLKIIKGKKSFF